MDGCFDPFRPRTHSFDLHQLMHRPKLIKFSKLFRSRSENSMKSPAGSPSTGSPKASPVNSPRSSPKPSPGAPHKRRFMRVVRDGDSSGEGYDNPHVMRKYSQKYAHHMYTNKKSQSLDENQPLPYTVTGHTILKKHSSFDQGGSPVVESPDQSPPSSKHASFRDEVEVIEYDRKEKIQKHCCFTHREQLVMEEVDVNLRLLSVAGCVIEECEGDDPKDQLDLLDGEVFQLDDDLSSDSDIVDQQPLPELPHSFEMESQGLSRQLSSGSDSSSDCERPTRVKKTRFDETSSHTLQQADLSSADKSRSSLAGSKTEEERLVRQSRKMVVES